MVLTEIAFGKSHYHLQESMIDWCRKNIGKGGWEFSATNDEDALWLVSSAFGNTFFKFKESKDAVWFALQWK